MNYNYHTHTALCGHASGTMEEYVLRAIECGVKYMGFSDHIPLKMSDGTESPHRVPTQKAEWYISEVRRLREKYKDKIEISIGFEAEYYPEYFNTAIENATRLGAEYIILGQHFLSSDESIHSISPHSESSLLDEYISLVSAAIRSGKITYVAHPDMFNFVGDEAIYNEKIGKLCDLANEYGTPFEINLLGIRDGRCYPNEKFWKIVGKKQVKVTFGFDAHDPKNAYDGDSIPLALELVKKFSLNYIGKPDLVYIRK